MSEEAPPPRYWSNVRIPCASPWEAVGLQNSRLIPDDHFTATSSTEECKPSAARMGGARGWMPLLCDTDPFLEIDLGESQLLVGVELAGPGEAMSQSQNPLFVSEFTLSTSVNGRQYIPHPCTFPGLPISGPSQKFRRQAHSVRRALTPPVLARFVRIHPLQWVGPAPAFRCELFVSGTTNTLERLTLNSLPSTPTITSCPQHQKSIMNTSTSPATTPATPATVTGTSDASSRAALN